VAGDAAAVSRILRGLQGEGEEPTLVLWALAREVRSLAVMAAEIRRGAPPEQALAKQGVWENRKALVRDALKRHSLQGLHRLLRQAARTDRVIKGAQQGRGWDELLQLALGLTGAAAIREHLTVS
jgi:DNA polymerase-3 subunit delta